MILKLLKYLSKTWSKRKKITYLPFLCYFFSNTFSERSHPIWCILHSTIPL